MDPRRILVLADPERPEIQSLISRIPGAREVIVVGEGTPPIPGIRIRSIRKAEAASLASESKATLIIAAKEIQAPGDLLRVPSAMREDTRQITDRILIWVPPDRGSRQAILAFLDQVTAMEVHLLVEGDMDPEIPLHAPQAAVSVQIVEGELQDEIAGAATELNPSLIVMPKRIAGTDRSGIPEIDIPLFIPRQAGGAISIRELGSGRFEEANLVWIGYHETKGDPRIDRIFAAFEGDRIVSLARCRHHPDGVEVDAVFTPEPYRGRGLSRRVMEALVEACYNEDMTMYAVQHLKKFYSEYGFVPVPEGELPASVRERYLWAEGNLEGAEVIPMRRIPGRPPLLTGFDTHK